MNIPQMEPWFGPEEKIAMAAYMDEGGWITEFKKTAEFEGMIAAYTGAKHCIVVNNGTISLTLAAMAVGVEAGDEVIIPNFTMIASPNSTVLFGAKPVFVDVERETLCMDIKVVEQAITTKTKAIMLVCANGRYPKGGIEAFQKIAEEHHIALIEDAAQALGSHYPDGAHMGTKGSVGSFSFSAPKVITTGQGGALITNDDEIANKIRRMKDFGRAKGGTDVHESIGWNFKFTELQAVIGVEQMKKLQHRVDRKKEILALYQKKLKPVTEVEFFNQDLTYTTPWFIDVLVEQRDTLMAYLKEKGIGTRLMYPPINKQMAYQYPGEFEVSNLVGQKGLWLPSASQLTDEQVEGVCDTITSFYQK